MPEIIRYDVINRYHNNLSASHFGIKKTKELVTKKYFWPSLRKDIKAYLKDCDIYLVSKVVRHKLYEDLQSLPISTH